MKKEKNIEIVKLTDHDRVFKLFIKELYGVSVKDLSKLDRLCKWHGVFWYHLVYTDKPLFNEFIDYFIDKYKLEPKRFWKEEIALFYVNYGPTFSKKRYQESLSKVKGDKEIQKILNKINVFGFGKKGDQNEKRKKNK